MATRVGTQDADFQAALEENLRGLQILQAAFSMGVVLFGLVVAALYFLGEGNAKPDPAGQDLTILTGVHAVMAIGCFAVGMSLFSLLSGPLRSLQKSALHSQEGGGQGSAHKLFALLRGVLILRLALLEGAALFGLVVCLLGTLNGTLEEKPLFWLNALSAVIFLAFSAATFPTRERVVEMLLQLMKSGAA